MSESTQATEIADPERSELISIPIRVHMHPELGSIGFASIRKDMCRRLAESLLQSPDMTPGLTFEVSDDPVGIIGLHLLLPFRSRTHLIHDTRREDA